MRGKRLLSSIFTPDRLKKIGIYSALTLVLGCMQCAFFPMLDFCPKTPDLILAMLVATVLLDSPKSAAIAAVAAGFFIDAIGGGSLALAPIIYLITVLLISLLSGKILNGFASFLLLMLPALLCRGIATYICIFIFQRALPGAWVFLDVLLPEAICTALCALPIYFLVKLCSIPLSKHSRFTF